MREESGGIFRWLGVEVGGVPVSHGPLCFSHSSRLKVANGQSAWRLSSIHLMSRFSSEFSASSAAMSSANPFIQFRVTTTSSSRIGVDFKSPYPRVARVVSLNDFSLISPSLSVLVPQGPALPTSPADVLA